MFYFKEDHRLNITDSKRGGNSLAHSIFSRRTITVNIDVTYNVCSLSVIRMKFAYRF